MMSVGLTRNRARTLIAAVIGYGLGAIPSAAIAMRIRGYQHDLTRSGTGNPGAYNVSVHLGRRWGAAVAFGDVMKGVLAALIGRQLAGDDGCYAAATTAVLGHVVPPGWRGGRGVATSWGTCLVVFPIYAPIDAGLAAGLALRRRRAPAGTRIRPAVIGTTVAFVASTFLWTWRKLPNPRGPKVGRGLVAYAAITSAAMLWRWAPDHQPAPASVDALPSPI